MGSPCATTPPLAKPLTMAEWKRLFKLIPGFDIWRDSAGCKFCVASANFAVNFIQTHCRHVKGDLAGQTITLERWQKAIVGAIFGWKRADGRRRFWDVFFYIPRKNGKTILLACIAILMLACSREGGQEIYSAAAEKEQARIAHEMAKQMVEMDPLTVTEIGRAHV